MKVWFHYHPEHEPWAIVVYSHGTPIAAALLSRQRRAGVWRISRPGEGDIRTGLATMTEEAAHALAESLADAIDSFGGPWIFGYPGLEEPTPVVAHLLSRWRYSEGREGIPAPFLECGPGASAQSRVSRNTRNVVAKARNRINRDSITLREQWTSDPSAIMARFPEIVMINRARNRQLRQHSELDDPVVAAYYIDLLTALVRYGRIELFTLELNDELAAFAICSREAGECWVLANLASPRWLRYSPGTIANTAVVLHSLDDPECQGVDWGMGVQRYKLSGGAILRPRHNISAWSSPPVRLLSWLYEKSSASAPIFHRSRRRPIVSRVVPGAQGPPAVQRLGQAAVRVGHAQHASRPMAAPRPPGGLDPAAE